MPAANNIVPIVGDLHYNDLLNHFEVRASLELKTPVGNFRKEFRVTVGDMASAILWLTNIWSGASLGPGLYTLGYDPGDLHALGEALTSGPTLEPDIADLPVPVDVPDTGGDGGGWVTWDGSGALIGDPMWGETPP